MGALFFGGQQYRCLMIDLLRFHRLFAAAGAALLLALAFVFPLHLAPWATFHNEFLFAAAVLLLVSVHLDRAPSIGVAFHVSCAAIILMMGLHAAWGTAPREQAWAIGVYTAIALLAFHIGAQRQGSRQMDGILWPLAAAAVLSALIAVFQWTGALAKGDWDPAFFFPSPGGGRTASNIAQANNFGTLLIIGLWSCLFLLQREWERPQMRRLAEWVAGGALALLVLGIYLSGSRAAVLNLALAPVFMAGWLWWRRRSIRSALLIWVIAPIVLLVVLQAVMPAVADWLGLLQPPEDRSLTDDNQRLRLWAMVWAAVLESPWWGHGLTAMAETHLRLSPLYGAFDYRIATQAHNTVLDLLLMFGIPVGGAIAAGVVWLWWRAWRAARKPAQLFAWLMCTAMLVHALLEYPLHYGFFLWLLCLLLGYLTGTPGQPVALRRPVLAGMAWLALAGAAVYPFWRGYVEVEKLYTLLRQQGPLAVQAALPQAHPFSRALYPGLLDRLNWISRPIADMPSLTNGELTALVQTTRSYPLPGLLWRTTLAYAYRGDTEQAAWYGQRLCSMFHPGLCETAAKEWPELGKDRADWPDLPWQAWRDAPIPGRQP